MRIIGGKFRKKKLLPVSGTDTRPTSDRLRESIFNIISGKPDGAFVLDLFAGTGALGLEALSRNAEKAVFIEVSQKAVAVIRKNIGTSFSESQAEVIKWDIIKNLNCLQGRKGFSLVFMDPPYHKEMIGKTLIHLDKTNALSDGALIIAEHSSEEKLSEYPESFSQVDFRRYGKSAVSFFRFKKHRC